MASRSKGKTVVIEHIVSKGTIDEQIIQALEGKHKVQDSLISAVKVNLSKSESTDNQKESEVKI